jgi:hypothetical protein
VDENLFMIAAKACKGAYASGTKILTTEYSITEAQYDGETIDVLAFAGTDEALDWVLNLLPFSCDGVKFGSHLSVERVADRFRRTEGRKLLVCGHSKAGPTAFKWKQKYGADWCVVFCPAPGFKRHDFLADTVKFIDLDDIVPKAGRLLFKHPVCSTVYMPKNRPWWDIRGRIKEHFMDRVIEYLKNNKGKVKVTP